jgi:hypothetical protein
VGASIDLGGLWGAVGERGVYGMLLVLGGLGVGCGSGGRRGWRTEGGARGLVLYSAGCELLISTFPLSAGVVMRRGDCGRNVHRKGKERNRSVLLSSAAWSLTDGRLMKQHNSVNTYVRVVNKNAWARGGIYGERTLPIRHFVVVADSN